MPLIIVAGREVYLERADRVVSLDQLPQVVTTEPSSLFVAHNVGLHLRRLDRRFTDIDRWQFRITPVLRDVYDVTGEKRHTKIQDTVVAFFGFTGKPNRYHYPIDPLAFSRQTVFEMRGVDGTEMESLFAWACDVREFAQENDLTVKATAGGLAVQLLRDSRFFPEPRRKVPAATNAKAREALPGNLYRLHTQPRRKHFATYLDQENAHHSAARDLAFPNPDTLYAKGFYVTPRERPYLTPNRDAFHRLIKQPGLFYVFLQTPHIPASRFPLPCMERAGSRMAYLFSNELEYVSESGGQIHYIAAAWTSPERAPGLNRYAEWSLAQAKACPPTRRGWLKPTLLATYGMLAARPRALEFGYRRAKGGRECTYPVGGGMVDVIAKRTANAHEPNVADVIARGMIEAETRLRTLRLARTMKAAGLKVLALYADSLFVDDEGQDVPLVPPPWRVKGRLTALEFFNRTSFASRELIKLPGIPREDADRLARVQEFRRRISGTDGLAQVDKQ